METEKIEHEYMYYKTALAIALIRMKPDDVTLENFLLGFQANFKKDCMINRHQINELKSIILQSKQELLMLKNNEPTCAQNNNFQQNELKKDDIDNKAFHLDYDLKENLSKHLDFTSKIVKLINIKENENLNDISSELIFESLITFLGLINDSFLEADLLVENHDENPVSVKPLYPMSRNALEHDISIFMQIFDSEAIDYMRPELLGKILEIINKVLNFIISCDSSARENLTRQECGCNILLIFSSCDYLLDSLLTEMICHLNIGLTEIIRIYHSDESSVKNAEQRNKLMVNCCSICDCLENIVMIRKLKKTNSNEIIISTQLKSVLLQTLDQVYIDLVQLEDPLLAFQVTKIIQILALEIKN